MPEYPTIRDAPLAHAERVFGHPNHGRLQPYYQTLGSKKESFTGTRNKFCRNALWDLDTRTPSPMQRWKIGRDCDILTRVPEQYWEPRPEETEDGTERAKDAKETIHQQLTTSPNLVQPASTPLQTPPATPQRPVSTASSASIPVQTRASSVQLPTSTPRDGDSGRPCPTPPPSPDATPPNTQHQTSHLDLDSGSMSPSPSRIAPSLSRGEGKSALDRAIAKTWAENRTVVEWSAPIGQVRLPAGKSVTTRQSGVPAAENSSASETVDVSDLEEVEETTETVVESDVVDVDRAVVAEKEEAEEAGCLSDQASSSGEEQDCHEPPVPNPWTHADDDQPEPISDPPYASGSSHNLLARLPLSPPSPTPPPASELTSVDNQGRLFVHENPWCLVEAEVPPDTKAEDISRAQADVESVSEGASPSPASESATTADLLEMHRDDEGLEPLFYLSTGQSAPLVDPTLVAATLEPTPRAANALARRPSVAVRLGLLAIVPAVASLVVSIVQSRSTSLEQQN